MAVLKEFVEKQNHQVSECEGELSGLRRRIDSLETDREQDKKVILSLQANINNARNVRAVCDGVKWLGCACLQLLQLYIPLWLQ